MKRTSAHWTDKYGHPNPGTFGYKVLVVAGMLPNPTEDHCRAIASLADAQQVNLRHATATFYGTIDRCECVPCRTRRGEKVVPL